MKAKPKKKKFKTGTSSDDRKARPSKPSDGPIGKLLAKHPYQIEDGVTQSMLSGWGGCRVACRYGLDGWRTGFTKDALNYGSLYHDLLEKFFRGVMNDGLTVADVEPFMEAFLEKWLAKQRQGVTSPKAIQASELCTAQVAATFPGYCEMWKDDFVEDRWVELEGVFEADFHGFKLRGRMDGLQRCGKKRKYLRLMEHKTMSRIEEEAINRRLPFDFQNLFYLTALNCQLKARGEKEQAHYVIYDIIRRPGLKYNPDKEPLKDYTERVKEHVLTNKTGPGPKHYYKRSEIAYTQKDLKVFQEELLLKLRLFEAWLKGDEPTYKNEQACVSKWNCTYLDACAAGGNMSGYEQSGELFVELKD